MLKVPNLFSGVKRELPSAYCDYELVSTIRLSITCSRPGRFPQ
jgi:hypothetical protein